MSRDWTLADTAPRALGCGVLSGCVLGSLPLVVFAFSFIYLLVNSAAENRPLGIEGEQITGLFLSGPFMFSFCAAGEAAIGAAVGLAVSLLMALVGRRHSNTSVPSHLQLGFISAWVGLCVAMAVPLALFVLSTIRYGFDGYLFAVAVIAPALPWALIAFLISKFITQRRVQLQRLPG